MGILFNHKYLIINKINIMKFIQSIKKLPLKMLSIVIFTSTVFAACQKDENTDLPTTRDLPEEILLKETALYPEGIAYSSGLDKILVGSYYKGKIVQVDLEGNITPFASDDNLVSVVGLAIDEKNERLIGTNSDSGLGEKSQSSTTGVLAEVFAYDLNSGERVMSVDLSGLYLGGHFINDVALDEDGNIYATDSFSPVIYKIDEQGKASVLVSNDAFIPPQGAFGLNGIVYHPDGYLITGLAYNGELFKIPLSDPGQIQSIDVNQSVNSLDGLLLIDNQTLALVSNNFTGAPFNETVYQLKSATNWETATVQSAYLADEGSFPTTLTSIDGSVYVNYGYFQGLVSAGDPVEVFNINKVLF
ncbi:MAG TPA: hypothetical protein DDX92_07090 [Flavobacteriales bacterium]|nr:hypothetical protein [Flavobacteriales bacterium]